MRVTVGGTTAYAGQRGLPPLVTRALGLADRLGFDHSCDPQQGRLLAVLAHGCAGGRFGETGTGCGVGLAWMLDAVGPGTGTSVTSVELDRGRAEASAGLVAGHPGVRVLQGDWTTLREHGPFDLLVLDGGGKGKEPGEEPLDPTAGWLAVGGTLVLDDFVPAGQPGSERHDPARRHWLEHPALRAVELRLTATLATVVGVRVR